MTSVSPRFSQVGPVWSVRHRRNDKEPDSPTLEGEKVEMSGSE